MLYYRHEPHTIHSTWDMVYRCELPIVCNSEWGLRVLSHAEYIHNEYWAIKQVLHSACTICPGLIVWVSHRTFINAHSLSGMILPQYRHDEFCLSVLSNAQYIYTSVLSLWYKSPIVYKQWFLSCWLVSPEIMLHVWCVIFLSLSQ